MSSTAASLSWSSESSRVKFTSGGGGVVGCSINGNDDGAGEIGLKLQSSGGDCGGDCGGACSGVFHDCGGGDGDGGGGGGGDHLVVKYSISSSISSIY